MRLEVWEPGRVPPHNNFPDQEEPTYLRLHRADGNIVTLMVVDRQGTRRPCGNLIAILPDGSVSFCGGVGPEFGFPLGKSGVLKAAKP